MARASATRCNGHRLRVAGERDVFVEGIRMRRSACIARRGHPRAIVRPSSRLRHADAERAKSLAERYRLNFLVTTERLDLPVAYSSGPLLVYVCDERFRPSEARNGHVMTVYCWGKPRAQPFRGCGAFDVEPGARALTAIAAFRRPTSGFRASRAGDRACAGMPDSWRKPTSWLQRHPAQSTELRGSSRCRGLYLRPHDGCRTRHRRDRITGMTASSWPVAAGETWPQAGRRIWRCHRHR
jgi:hypothetical protein